MAQEKTPPQKPQYSRFWLRKKWWFFGVLGAIILAELLFQIWYPADRTLPFARYDGHLYGLKSYDEVAAREQAIFMNAKASLGEGPDAKEVLLGDLGATLDDEASFRQLHAVPLALKMIPFSILFLSPNVEKLPLQFSDAPLDAFVSLYAAQQTREPADAVITIQDGKIVMHKAKEGRHIDEKTLKNTIKTAQYPPKESIKIDISAATIRVPSRITQQDLEPVRQEIERIHMKKIHIQSADGEEQATLENDAILSLLTIQENDETNMPEVRLHQENAAVYAQDLNKKVYRAPEKVTVIVQDGRDGERSGGADGQEINKEQFFQQLHEELFGPVNESLVIIPMQTIPAPVEHIYQYTNSQAGLQAKVEEIGRRYDVRISLQQMNGAGWRAEWHGNEQTPSASTYKLYIAMTLLPKIQSGEISWSDPMLDTNVAGCFERMIVVSTNQCAEKWLDTLGRRAIDDYIHQRGISQATTFLSYDAAKTSANDLNKAVRGIYTGEYISGDERAKMLELMGRQIWRRGIPSGAGGPVQDKVGFLWSYVHDVGIVYHPRGTYILAVMTRGANYQTIAQITREVEQVMYP